MYATLANVNPKGMSETTARGSKCEKGVTGSRKVAEEDLRKFNELRADFSAAENATGMPAPLIAAVASRESRIGKALPASGYGYDGHGYGIMQVDDRYHDVDKSNGPLSRANILQGAGILRDSIRAVEKKFPNWRKEDQLQGGVAAYNFGVKNVQTVEGIDRGTTGNDYSNDTIARAQYHAQKM